MIDLSDNTNAWGMPPAARDAIATSTPSSRYPTPYADDLKSAISMYVGLPTEMITTGCGSDDVLDATIRALGRPGSTLAFPTPTFAMIPTFAALNGQVPRPTPVADLARSGARLIYLCSPNNPTGTLVSREVIADLVSSTADDQVMIVDEAYAEFAGQSVAGMVRGSNRLVVTRTMSKAFGLAGLRVGYGLACPELITAIEASRGPYKVGAIAERAAVAALTSDCGWMSEHVRMAVEVRERLALELKGRGLHPLPSAANFVFVPMENAIAVATRMVERGVRVRAFADPPGLRITVAPWDVMRQALDALDEALRCA
jgi:histidinol-phosphate aminotransferase